MELQVFVAPETGIAAPTTEPMVADLQTVFSDLP